jgi:uncharacterized protein (DUF302 family)
MRWITLLPLLLSVTLAQAAEGLLTAPSPYSVADTTDRLEQTVTAKGFRVFARVDHAQGAAGVDMALRPTQLLIFGNPKGGTVLMQKGQSIGIDLPLKYLVWQDADGKVWVGWNEPAYLAARHGLSTDIPVFGKMTQGLAGMAKAATAP